MSRDGREVPPWKRRDGMLYGRYLMILGRMFVCCFLLLLKWREAMGCGMSEGS
jgi:hypothetical protein